jgi:hypothetical protein
MSTSDEVAICNTALQWLGQAKITSLEDSGRPAELCRDNYDELRKAVLEDGADWSFATKRYKLDEILPPSEDRWGDSNWFTIPAETLLVRMVFFDPDFDREVPGWTKEENKLVVDGYDIIYVKTIHDVTNAKLFTPSFRQALSARIAAELAIPITKSLKIQNAMWATYDAKLDKATNADGMQGAREQVRSGRLLRVRGR